MAKEGERTTSSDKGKGKAPESSGKGEARKAEDIKKDKDGKPLANGKKGEAPKEGMLFPHLRITHLILHYPRMEISRYMWR
jgi:hypothetical protein